MMNPSANRVFFTGVVVSLLCSLLLLSQVNARLGRVKSQSNPGFITMMPESSFNYILGQVWPGIKEQIMNTPLPDVEQELESPIGVIAFNLTQIKLNTLTVDQMAIRMVQDTGFQLVVKNAAAQLSGKWSYRRKAFPHTHDKGTVDVSIGVDVTGLVHMTQDEAGHLVVRIDPKVQIEFTHFDVIMHGGASWLYNIFISALKRKIQESITNNLTAQIDHINEQLKQKLDSIPYLVQFGNPDAQMELDLSVVQTVFSTSYPVFFAAGSKAQFSQVGGLPYQGALSPQIPYQPITNQPNMMQIMITEYVPNTLAWAYYQSGLLRKILTDKDIPPKVPLRLTTASLMLLAPGLYNKYPNMPVQLTVQVAGTDPAKAPNTKITEGNGASVTALGEGIFSVVKPDGSVEEAFTLGMTVSLDLVLSIQNGVNITGKLTFESVQLVVESSNVGEVHVSGLNDFISGVVQYLALPIVNLVLAQGIPIPTIPGVTLQTPELIFKNSFIGLASNFTYEP